MIGFPFLGTGIVIGNQIVADLNLAVIFFVVPVQMNVQGNRILSVCKIHPAICYNGRCADTGIVITFLDDFSFDVRQPQR